jgi:hypothetical protein
MYIYGDGMAAVNNTLADLENIGICHPGMDKLSKEEKARRRQDWSRVEVPTAPTEHQIEFIRMAGDLSLGNLSLIGRKVCVCCPYRTVLDGILLSVVGAIGRVPIETKYSIYPTCLRDLRLNSTDRPSSPTASFLSRDQSVEKGLCLPDVSYRQVVRVAYY